MTEAGGNVEFIGVGKPEPVESTREHPAVKAVKGALTSWWERVGPGSVEKSFILAHDRILTRIEGEDRKKAFAKSSEAWRKVGKGVGIAATGLDFGVSGLGLLTFRNANRVPLRTEDFFYKHIIQRFRSPGLEELYATVTTPVGLSSSVVTAIINRQRFPDQLSATEKTREQVGRIIASMPLIGAGGIGVLGGPAHLLSHVAAGAVGLGGEGVAIVGNYVASGKAAEHAKKVGESLGKGTEVAVKYAAEHPEEIRKTMRTVEDIRKDRERERAWQEMSKQRAAEAAFEKRYQGWLAGMDGNLKAFYRDSHITPTREEFMKQTGDNGAVAEEPRKKKSDYWTARESIRSNR